MDKPRQNWIDTIFEMAEKAAKQMLLGPFYSDSTNFKSLQKRGRRKGLKKDTISDAFLLTAYMERTLRDPLSGKMVTKKAGKARLLIKHVPEFQKYRTAKILRTRYYEYKKLLDQKLLEAGKLLEAAFTNANNCDKADKPLQVP